MSGGKEELRALSLSVLVVFSVFAGVVSFGGTGLAATTNAGTVSIGNSPSVDVADATVDPSSSSEVPVAINVASEGVAPSDIEIRSKNESSGNPLNKQTASGVGLSSLADTGNVTIPDTVSADFVLNVTVFDNGTGTPQPIAGAAGTSSVTVSGGGGGNAYINGTVTETDGTAVGSAPVYAIPASGTTVSGQTNASGGYSLSVSADTTYDVYVDNHPKHEYEVRSGVAVSASSTQVVDFQLTPYPDTGTITGTLVDADGNPVQGTTVYARDLGYRFSGEATTDSNGDFSMSVPASDYLVRAQPSGSPPAQVEGITVQAGQTTDIGQLQVPAAGYIAGTVTNGSGAVSGVNVVADGGDRILHRVTDGSGTYNITVPDGNYTVSVFARGQDGDSKRVTVNGGSTTTADFTLRNTSVVHSSVEVIDGSGVDTSNLGIAAGVRRGMLQVKVTNQSSPSPGGVGGAPHELEGLGVTGDTKLRMNVTVTNFTANSLMWGVGDAEWSTSDNATVTNGTDITVEGTPVQLQVMFGGSGGAETGVGPLVNKDPSEVSWPTGRDDEATAGRNQTVYFGVFDLSNVPGSVQRNLNGMSVTTNAQRFSMPSVVNDSLQVWVAAPTKTVGGNDHNGFYKAEIPQSQLDEWGVSDPESELNALYKGDQANFSVTDTAEGAEILLQNISYSAGYTEIQANPTSGGGGGDGGSSGGGGGGAAAGTSVSVQRTAGSVRATVERVSAADPTVTVPVEDVSGGSVAVRDVSVSFGQSTNSPTEIDISAAPSRPAGSPVPPTGDRTFGYVTVDLQGTLASSVTGGTVTVDVAGSDADPAAVRAYRYHDGAWQRVETRVVDGTTVEVRTPGYSTFAIGAPPEGASTPTPASETPTPAGPTRETASTEPTPTETAGAGAGDGTPAATRTPTVGTTPTGTPAPTPGSSGPGFGVAVAVLALFGALALRRR